MDITLECNVSLSKKLRSIIGDSEGRVILILDPVRNGTGKGSLLISGEHLDLNVATQAVGKETSIQFTPVAIKNEVPSGAIVSNLFSTGNLAQRGQRTPVDRIAATIPPDKYEVSHAILREEEVRVPEEFSVHKEPKFQAFISSFEELMMAVKAAQGKESEIDLDSIQDTRSRAIAKEMKEKAEAIDIPAFIVNDTCSAVTLNDMDLSLGLNMPVNLANISAKRIADSGDLKSMLRSKMIKFIKPDEVSQYRAKAAEGVEKPGLETYSTRSEASGAIGGTTHVPAAEEMDVPTEDDSPNEQEQLAGLLNLTSMGDNFDGGSVRTSFHGLGGQRMRKTVSNQSSSNPKGIKTISRA